MSWRRNVLGVAFIAMYSLSANAQFWSESFETDGEGTRYTTSNSFFRTTSDHFQRTDNAAPNAIGNVGGDYSGADGSYYWAGEDLDDATGGDGSPLKTMTFTGISIAAMSNIEIRGLFATGNPGNGWDAADELYLEYQVDAGGYALFMEFAANASTGSNLGMFHDSDLDGLGESGSPLSTTLTEYISALTVSGTLMDIRITCRANSASEEFAFDNLRVFDLSGGTPGCMDTTACNFNSAATVSDGSCTYPGCDNSTAINYNSAAGCTDGSCYFTLPNLVINEIHYNPNDPAGYPDIDYEYLEIYNADAQAWDLETYTISAIGFTFPIGASISAGEYIVLAINSVTYSGNGYQVFDYGGALVNSGELVEIVDPFSNIVDSVDYDDAIPWPLLPDGYLPSLALNNTSDDNSLAGNWHWSDCLNYINGSPGVANPGPLAGCTDPSAANYEECAFTDDGSCVMAINDIVINELHYNPCGAQGTDADFEFIELFNQGTTTIDISGWEITGFEYAFPALSSIAPCEYIIMTANAASYTGNGYQVFETAVPTAGLNNTGELVTLLDDLGNVIDGVNYSSSAPWPTGPNGTCTTLELVNANTDNGDSANWQESLVDNGTPGAPNSVANFYSCTDCGVGSTTTTLLSDDFEVGDITDWTESTAGNWTADNVSPIAGTFSMAHDNAGVTSSDYIAQDLGCFLLDEVCTTWRLQMSNSTWVADANNRLWIWLMADDAALDGASTSGYALTFDTNASAGGEMSLCRIDNGAIAASLITTNFTWTAGNSVGLEVIHTETNTWYVKIDHDGGFDQLLAFTPKSTDQTYLEGKYTGAYFQYDATGGADLSIDDFSVEQCGTVETYYSVDSGNVSAAIWSIDPSAGVGNGETVFFNHFKSVIVTNSQTVALDNDVVLSNLTIGDATYGTGTLNTAAGERITITGNWLNDATFTANTGSVRFKGTAAQTIGGTGATVFNDIEVNKEANGVQLTGTISVHGSIYPTLGNFDINAQSMTLTSDATGTGAIAEIMAGADVFGGTITLERYIAASTQQTWMNLGNPLTGTTITDWDNEMTTTGFTGADYEYADYPFINVYSYDEATAGDLDQGFTAPTNVTDVLLSQQGYMVYLEPAAQLIDATGNFQKGAVSHSMNFNADNGLLGDGWNLVTNIYPSAISWTDLYTASSGIGSSYYVHDGDGFGGTRNYIFYDAVSGLGTASDVIASGQALWVKIDAAGGTLEYTESVKTQAASAFERQLLHLPAIGLRLFTEQSTDHAYIAFDEAMSTSYDSGRDALHIGGMSLQDAVGLATVAADDYALSINNVTGFQDLDGMPIKVISHEAQSMLFEIIQWDEIPEGACVVIEDLIAGTMTPLEQGTSFEFETEISNGVRFMLHYQGQAQMDVQDAMCNGSSNGGVTATALGAGPFTYTWYDEMDNAVAQDEAVMGSSTIDGLFFGNYAVTIEGENMLCASTTQSVYVDQAAEETAELTYVVAGCNADEMGSIEIDVDTDSYNYMMYDEDNQPVLGESDVWGISEIEALDAQQYTVEITTSCSSFALVADLRDSNAVEVNIYASAEELTMFNGAATFAFMGEIINADDAQWLVDGELASTADILNAEITEAGAHTVELIATNGQCSDSELMEIIALEETVGVNEITGAAFATVLNGDNMQITALDSSFKQAQISVYNQIGQLIVDEQMSGPLTTISTSEWGTGSYTMRIILNGQNAHTFRFVR
jgi:hypothetical protein